MLTLSSLPETLNQMYRNMDATTYLDEIEHRSKAAHKILETIEKIKPQKGNILAIGCSAGILLDQARQQRWQVYGVELSKNTFNLENIQNTDFLNAEFENYFFDVIILTNVIEHLPNLRQYLDKMKRHLHPDGYIYLTTPNIRSWAHRLLKQKCWGSNLAHLHYFSPKTLREMLTTVGFRPTKYHTMARYFSLKHLRFRFEALAPKLSRIFKILPLRDKYLDSTIKVNLGGQIGILAQKNSTIKSVLERETYYETMLEQKKGQPKPKVIAVLPAYNAAKTLEKTVADIPRDIVDEIILVDDYSTDNTTDIAKSLGLVTIRHIHNTGYGGNQKTCYREALKYGADIIIMVHPDYQYDPKAIVSIIEPIINQRADAVFGSRMMKGTALAGGMPLWKHNVNIMLTSISNIIFRTYLTEYHSGFRAFSKDILENINLSANQDSFVFDFEMIAQIINKRYKIEEIPIKTRYFDEASSIKIGPAIIYGYGILWILVKFYLHEHLNLRFKIFE